MNSNRVMLITGATSGIGKALADHYYKKNYKLILTGNSKEKIEKLDKKFKKNTLVIQANLTKTNDIKNIDLFFDLLDQSSNTLSIDFLKLERLIKNLYKSETSTEKNPIKFLTIQKSKGLEFDCVIIPNLNKGSRTEIQDLILYDKSTLSIKHPTNNKNLHTYHSYKEKKRLDNEKIRLLYVAITRAKNKCYLIGTIKKDGDKLIPKSGTFMEILWPFMNEKFTEIDVPKSIHSYEDFIPKLRRLNGDFFTKINPVNDKKDIELITFSYSSNNQDIQRFTGNIVHKYLEIIIKKQLDINIILSNKLGYIESYPEIINSGETPLIECKNHTNIHELVSNNEEHKIICRTKYTKYMNNNFNVIHRKYNEQAI